MTEPTYTRCPYCGTLPIWGSSNQQDPCHCPGALAARAAAEENRVRPDGPETARGGLIGQAPY